MYNINISHKFNDKDAWDATPIIWYYRKRKGGSEVETESTAPLKAGLEELKVLRIEKEILLAFIF